MCIACWHDHRGCKFQGRRRQINVIRSPGRLATRAGRSVILADCDTQHSSSEWSEEATPGVRTIRLESPDRILDQLPHLKQEADVVIADGPGSNTETSRALLLRADIAIVPCKASMLEVRALAQATSVLRQAQDIRDGMPKAVIVLSMVGRNYRLTQDMKEAARALELPLAEPAITLRQVYADGPGQGAVVWKLGTRAKEAAEEICNLFDEIFPGLSPHPSSPKPKATRQLAKAET